VTISLAQIQALREAFGDRLQVNVTLKRFTAARIGGNADVMITVNSSSELEKAARYLWQANIPFVVLGSGSNVLVSDAGIRQVVILNHAKKIVFNPQSLHPTVWAESGVNFGVLARKAATHGLSGLEWAAGIPGTLGGAIYGNAGAHGSDMSNNLLMAEILHLIQTSDDGQHEILQEEWTVEQFEYDYRSSSLKRQPDRVVVLSAQLKLSQKTPEAVQAKMEEYAAMRRNSQPGGASLGSIFKNPPGDYAGRLIEAAGLKGRKIGKVEVSQKHANFFINQDSATASDYEALIRLVHKEVLKKQGIDLELEIELVGDWSERQRNAHE
jgi:UDP-N-acetylmuramate dehydrogenase